MNYQNPKTQGRYQEFKGDPNGDEVWFALNKALKEENFVNEVEYQEIKKEMREYIKDVIFRKL